ncbi:MAG: hypothetical protein P8X50_07450 [Maritimibacter sp.]
MKPIRAVILLGAMVSLTACGAVDGLVSRSMSPNAALLNGQVIRGEDGQVTRSASASAALLGATASDAPGGMLQASYNVVAVNVEVPESLYVSEANGYKPRADIVWRGDPAGNRYEQVDTIVTNAFEQGVSALHGDRDVVIDVELSRFHALTQRTRYTFGGEHEVWMNMTVRDAKTGEVIEPARRIGFNLPAAGGEQAVVNEQAGLTQKVVISNALEQLIQQELTRPHA